MSTLSPRDLFGLRLFHQAAGVDISRALGHPYVRTEAKANIRENCTLHCSLSQMFETVLKMSEEKENSHIFPYYIDGSCRSVSTGYFHF